MKRKTIIVMLTFVLIVKVSTAQIKTGSETNVPANIKSDLLTKVLSFGDDNLPSEYLLADPWVLRVNARNDIYIFDEQKIKVYDSSGKPKCIIGGPGEGPGEFGKYPNSVSITPAGYITASYNNTIYNIFKPDNSFIKKSDLKFNTVFNNFIKDTNLMLTRFSPVSMITALNENTLIMECSLTNPSVEKSGIRVQGLLYLTDKEAHFVAKSEVLWGKIGNWLTFHWSFINERTIVYSSANFTTDTNIQNKAQSEYIINIADITGAKKDEIRHKYQPVFFPDSIKKQLDADINRTKSMSSNQMYVLGAGGIESVMGMIQTDERIRDFGQYSPIQKIRTDGKYIFVFTHTVNKKGEIYTDIFDAETLKYINFVYFPFIPLVIKNGYAYRFNDFENNKAIYPKVEKYTIDHSVYGK